MADDYRVTIDRADNGYVVRAGCRVEVVEDGEDYRDDCEARTSLRLLYVILDMLGRLGSKHDAARVCVRIHNQDGDDITDRAV
jgi:hypothetical protein